MSKPYDPSSRSPELMYAALRTFWVGGPPKPAPWPTTAFLAGYSAGRIHGYEDAVAEFKTSGAGSSEDE